MSESVYFLSIFVPLGIILLIFAMKYYSAITQAKARITGEEGYRRLAEQAVASQTDTAARLASIEAAASDINTRLAAVEKILKDVG